MGDDILHVRHFKPEYFFLADVELISLEDLIKQIKEF